MRLLFEKQKKNKHTRQSYRSELHIAHHHRHLFLSFVGLGCCCVCVDGMLDTKSNFVLLLPVFQYTMQIIRNLCSLNVISFSTQFIIKCNIRCIAMSDCTLVLLYPSFVIVVTAAALPSNSSAIIRLSFLHRHQNQHFDSRSTATEMIVRVGSSIKQSNDNRRMLM